MALWIIPLRIVGILMWFGVVVDLFFFMQTDFANEPRFLAGQLIHNAEQLAVALVCFGVAAGLRQVRQTDERIARAAARRRAAQQQQTRNLAPDAPAPASTARYMDEGEKIRYSGGRTLRRIDRDYIDRKYAYRVPDPNVRAAPLPTRMTPGTEAQYAADTQPLKPRRPPPGTFQRALDGPVVDRELFRRGRDKQLRRTQAEQARKRHDS